jgi:hypothetical protein
MVRDKDSFLLRIYQKFLIGTEVCEVLAVDQTCHLLTIAEVARSYPMSLQQLCEVQTGFRFIALPLVLCDEDHAEIEAVFDTYFKVNS